jgi:hypothetical protein
MNKKCSNCRLVNFPDATLCARCRADLVETATIKNVPERPGSGFLVRALVCLCVCVGVLLGFYLSLIGTATSLTLEQKSMVHRAIGILKEKGFPDEARLLNSFTVFRSNDNWLNASVAKENAYAATNFPFEIITLYPDFFSYPIDDTERAAVLLHEAQHLKGKNEHDAYRFVWTHRKQLGWTMDKYVESPVWRNVRRQTKDNVPELFVCDDSQLGDCSE